MSTHADEATITTRPGPPPDVPPGQPAPVQPQVTVPMATVIDRLHHEYGKQNSTLIGTVAELYAVVKVYEQVIEEQRAELEALRG